MVLGNNRLDCDIRGCSGIPLEVQEVTVGKGLGHGWQSTTARRDSPREAGDALLLRNTGPEEEGQMLQKKAMPNLWKAGIGPSQEEDQGAWIPVFRSFVEES